MVRLARVVVPGLPRHVTQRKYRQAARIDGIRQKDRGRFRPPPAPQPRRTAQKTQKDEMRMKTCMVSPMARPARMHAAWMPFRPEGLGPPHGGRTEPDINPQT